jgi:hypothetical protein
MTRSTWIRWRTIRWRSSAPIGAPLARELDKAWDRFGSDLPKLAVPTLAVHGVGDPIAPIDAVRAYFEQIEPLRLKEFPGHHDILNETVHREVAMAVVDFVEEQVTGDPMSVIKKTTIAMMIALAAGVFLAAPANAEQGDNPCDLAMNFFCRFVPIAPHLEGRRRRRAATAAGRPGRATARIAAPRRHLRRRCI